MSFTLRQKYLYAYLFLQVYYAKMKKTKKSNIYLHITTYVRMYIYAILIHTYMYICLYRYVFYMFSILSNHTCSYE